jgi:hypothetical protein
MTINDTTNGHTNGTTNGEANDDHDEPYWLGRASEEQKRLLKQHGIWTK